MPAPGSLYRPTSSTFLTPLESVFAALATSIENTHLFGSTQYVGGVADLAAVAAWTTSFPPIAGDLLYIVEGDYFLRYNGAAWAQFGPSKFATVAARTTAYAKASGAYLVLNARSIITTDPTTELAYFTLYNATTNLAGAKVAGWYPVNQQQIYSRYNPTSGLALAATNSYIPFAPTSAYPGAFASANPTRIVLPFVGLWRITRQIMFNNASPQRVTMMIRLNGATIAPGSTVTGFGINGILDPELVGTCTVEATAATDYIEIGVVANSAAGNVSTTLTDTFVLVEYIGPVRA